MLKAVLRQIPREKVAVHFHDTYGNAAANVQRSWEVGVRRFDCSVGGLGGCPYAPGAPGNVATDLVLKTLRDCGAELALSADKLTKATTLARAMQRPPLA